MRGTLLGLMLMAVATGAPAQAVYRCVQKGKPVSYQTAPCPQGARIDRIREFVPERQPSANELAWKRYHVEREMAARHRAASTASTHTVVAPTVVSGESCAGVKAARDAWERRVGLSRTIEQLRWWQDRVYQACK